MKKSAVLALMALVLLAMASCKETPTGACHIHGTIPEHWNGKQIFLVPLTNDSRWNVDSVYIKDGKFEFVRDTNMVAKILVDYHYRLGLQPLLVVVEPGDVTVRIDSISSAKGTPQNDSLEKWKQATEQHHMRMAALQKTQQKQQADSAYLAYKKFTRQMAANLKGTVLGDFLKERFPLTYKKKMPDGTIKTFDSDTNEEVR